MVIIPARSARLGGGDEQMMMRRMRRVASCRSGAGRPARWRPAESWAWPRLARAQIGQVGGHHFQCCAACARSVGGRRPRPAAQPGPHEQPALGLHAGPRVSPCARTGVRPGLPRSRPPARRPAPQAAVRRAPPDEGQLGPRLKAGELATN